jgi:hypothetical protein
MGAVPHSFVLTLRLKRCQISDFLIVAGFGCDIAGKDPEPGRSDLFDPKYAPQPLELPRPTLEPAPDGIPSRPPAAAAAAPPAPPPPPRP